VSRNYLLLAGGLLLAVAAVIHFNSGWRTADDRPNAPNDADVAKPSGGGIYGGDDSIDGDSSDGRELVDPLVPPLRLEGLAGTVHAADDGHGAIEFAPHSLIGRIAATADFSADPVAHFHAHGEEVCASGCAASRHPTEELTRARFQELLEQYATEPMDESSFALESLLYYGRQTEALLQAEGDYPLDPLRSEFLREELKKTHAKIEVRVVDEYGEIRTWLPPTRVPLDRRHEFDMQVNNVQPLETSGTVKRVGLYHLWNRL